MNALLSTVGLVKRAKLKWIIIFSVLNIKRYQEVLLQLLWSHRYRNWLLRRLSPGYWMLSLGKGAFYFLIKRQYLHFYRMTESAKGLQGILDLPWSSPHGKCDSLWPSPSSALWGCDGCTFARDPTDSQQRPCPGGTHCPGGGCWAKRKLLYWSQTTSAAAPCFP